MSESKNGAEEREDHQSNAVDSIDRLRERELRHLTRREIRVRIARPVGLNTNPDTPFTLAELNSIYAHLEGEHYFPKAAYNTSMSPSIKELRVYLADAAPIVSYTITPEDYRKMDPMKPVRPYRRHELIQLCARVESTKDQRTA